MTVSVPGGAAVSAHRAVLAARSAQLRRLLAPAAGRPLLLLRGVSPDQLRLLLQLLYTGQAQAEHRQLRGECDDIGNWIQTDGWTALRVNSTLAKPPPNCVPYVCRSPRISI